MLTCFPWIWAVTRIHFFKSLNNFCSYNEPHAPPPTSLLSSLFVSLIWFYSKSLPLRCLHCHKTVFQTCLSVDKHSAYQGGFDINKWGMHTGDVTGACCQYNWMSVIPLRWETWVPIETMGYVLSVMTNETLLGRFCIFFQKEPKHQLHKYLLMAMRVKECCTLRLCGGKKPSKEAKKTFRKAVCRYLLHYG